MITNETTKVYVRVDLASQRVIGVSDEKLESRAGKPVFEVSAHYARLDYYVVEVNTSATFGITVRAANATEIAAADAKVATASETATAQTRKAKGTQVKKLYIESFMKRFAVAGFECPADLATVTSYSGTNTQIIDNVKPLAVTIENALVEWRFTVCQPVVDGILADAGVGAEINDAYRVAIEDTLDTFLTDHGFDIATYHR